VVVVVAGMVDVVVVAGMVVVVVGGMVDVVVVFAGTGQPAAANRGSSWLWAGGFAR
jgi:hypothetical protein